MRRSELVAELRAIEREIAEANDRFQLGNGPRPSEAVPDACARRKVLRRLLVERSYTVE